ARRLEAALDAKDSKTDGVAVHLFRFRPIGDTLNGCQTMIGQHATHAFRGTFAPASHNDACALLQGFDVVRGRLDYIDAAFLRALWREIASGLSARIQRML